MKRGRERERRERDDRRMTKRTSPKFRSDVGTLKKMKHPFRYSSPHRDHSARGMRRRESRRSRPRSQVRVCSSQTDAASSTPSPTEKSLPSVERTVRVVHEVVPVPRPYWESHPIHPVVYPTTVPCVTSPAYCNTARSVCHPIPNPYDVAFCPTFTACGTHHPSMMHHPSYYHASLHFHPSCGVEYPNRCLRPPSSTQTCWH